MLKNVHIMSNMLAMWQPGELCNVCYHFILLCLSIHSVADQIY